MQKVGITGGIGSGKTTACKIFETLGIPVYYADGRAKILMTENEELVKSIKQLFGEKAYLENGSLHRAYIAEIVFNDKQKLQQLNALVHPAVFKDGEQWHQSQTAVPYTLKEAALLFEGQGHLFLDKIITVYAPKKVRLQRVMERDNISKEAVESRMNQQMPDEKKLEMADFVIYNDGTQLLIPQIMQIHTHLKNNSSELL